MKPLAAYHFTYISSLGERHQIEFEMNSYDNVMQLIWDQGYEEWGDCKGRAWCATCHVKINIGISSTPMDRTEEHRIDQLYNRTGTSRLSCQLLLNQDIHKLELEYVGDESYINCNNAQN